MILVSKPFLIKAFLILLLLHCEKNIPYHNQVFKGLYISTLADTTTDYYSKTFSYPPASITEIDYTPPTDPGTNDYPVFEESLSPDKCSEFLKSKDIDRYISCRLSLTATDHYNFQRSEEGHVLDSMANNSTGKILLNDMQETSKFPTFKPTIPHMESSLMPFEYLHSMKDKYFEPIQDTQHEIYIASNYRTLFPYNNLISPEDNQETNTAFQAIDSNSTKLSPLRDSFVEKIMNYSKQFPPSPTKNIWDEFFLDYTSLGPWINSPVPAIPNNFTRLSLDKQLLWDSLIENSHHNHSLSHHPPYGTLSPGQSSDNTFSTSTVGPLHNPSSLDSTLLHLLSMNPSFISELSQPSLINELSLSSPPLEHPFKPFTGSSQNPSLPFQPQSSLDPSSNSSSSNEKSLYEESLSVHSPINPSLYLYPQNNALYDDFLAFYTPHFNPQLDELTKIPPFSSSLSTTDSNHVNKIFEFPRVGTPLPTQSSNDPAINTAMFSKPLNTLPKNGFLTPPYILNSLPIHDSFETSNPFIYSQPQAHQTHNFDLNPSPSSHSNIYLVNPFFIDSNLPGKDEIFELKFPHALPSLDSSYSPISNITSSLPLNTGHDKELQNESESIGKIEKLFQQILFTLEQPFHGYNQSLHNETQYPTFTPSENDYQSFEHLFPNNFTGHDISYPSFFQKIDDLATYMPYKNEGTDSTLSPSDIFDDLYSFSSENMAKLLYAKKLASQNPYFNVNFLPEKSLNDLWATYPGFPYTLPQLPSPAPSDHPNNFSRHPYVNNFPFVSNIPGSQNPTTSSVASILPPQSPAQQSTYYPFPFELPEEKSNGLLETLLQNTKDFLKPKDKPLIKKSKKKSDCLS